MWQGWRRATAANDEMPTCKVVSRALSEPEHSEFKISVDCIQSGCIRFWRQRGACLTAQQIGDPLRVGTGRVGLHAGSGWPRSRRDRVERHKHVSCYISDNAEDF